MAEADALWTGVNPSVRAALTERIARNSADLFLAVAEDEYYLNRIGLKTSCRGRELGRTLEDYLVPR